MFNGDSSIINLPTSLLSPMTGPLDDQQQQQFNSQSNIIMTNTIDNSFQEQDMGLFDMDMDYNDTMQVFFTIKTIYI
jgi:hypothetical protein